MSCLKTSTALLLVCSMAVANSMIGAPPAGARPAATSVAAPPLSKSRGGHPSTSGSGLSDAVLRKRRMLESQTSLDASRRIAAQSAAELAVSRRPTTMQRAPSALSATAAAAGVLGSNSLQLPADAFGALLGFSADVTEGQSEGLQNGDAFGADIDLDDEDEIAALYDAMCAKHAAGELLLPPMSQQQPPATRLPVCGIGEEGFDPMTGQEDDPCDSPARLDPDATLSTVASRNAAAGGSLATPSCPTAGGVHGGSDPKPVGVPKHLQLSAEKGTPPVQRPLEPQSLVTRAPSATLSALPPAPKAAATLPPPPPLARSLAGALPQPLTRPLAASGAAVIPPRISSTAAPILPRSQPPAGYHTSSSSGRGNGLLRTPALGPPATAAEADRRERLAATAVIAASGLAQAALRRAAAATAAAAAGPVSAKSKPAAQARPSTFLGMSVPKLGSTEAAAALARRSTHAELVGASVLQQVERDAGRLARLEEIGERLGAETSRDTVKWFCMECEKWFPRVPESCSIGKHTMQSKKVRLYSFSCRSCGLYATAEKSVHLAPCKKCGKVQWAAASIHAIARKAAAAAAAGPVPEFDPRGAPVEESLRGMGVHTQYASR